MFCRSISIIFLVISGNSNFCFYLDGSCLVFIIYRLFRMRIELTDESIIVNQRFLGSSHRGGARKNKGSQVKLVNLFILATFQVCN